eukprot:gb/GFBE01055283.1/.p1 GENE.gb/GFBE01055283.1/~~gb/GFBE01055283.1/.p1  ORF type:complete len:437 (+),score=68.73 gb/GFBE01055283.1/:1-1311(+)
MQAMDIHVELVGLGGLRHPAAGHSVEDLRQRAAEAFGTSPGAVTLCLGSEVLDDRRSLEQSGVNAGSELSVIIEPPVLVLDGGGSCMKAGLAGEDLPRSIFPSVVGRSKLEPAICVVGAAALVTSELELRRPIEHGIVVDWDAMEKVWHHTFFNELQLQPEQTPILLMERPLNPKANREKTVQIMFENFSVPSLHLAQGAMLCLYSCGKTTGIVVDVGCSVTHAVPVYDGYVLPHASLRFNLAGRDLTRCLGRLLACEGYSLDTSSENDICEKIKETKAFVRASSAELEPTAAKAVVSYELPDGAVLEIPNQVLANCAEALFQPCLLGFSMGGIHSVVYEAMMRCDVEIRNSQILPNVVVSGGSSMFPGFSARLQMELQELVNPACRVQVSSTPGPGRFAAWMGGSGLGALRSFREMFVSKADYDEKGPSIVHNMC